MSRQSENGRLAIIAGNGNLPLYVAEAARGRGEDPYIFALKGESSIDWSGFEHLELPIGEIRQFQQHARKLGIRRLVLSGGIRRRPEWREFRVGLSSLWRLPHAFRTMVSGGDNMVLRMTIEFLEDKDFKVIGVHEVVPDLLAQAGQIGRIAPDQQSRADIAAAMQAALRLGELDIGQGAIAVGGRVVALEGPEGTDAMLARVAEMKAINRISSKRRGVLVKLCKPSQDMRVDLPSAGLATIRNAASAGLAGIALEAGRSLLLDHQAVVDYADQQGMFVLGIDHAEGNGASDAR